MPSRWGPLLLPTAIIIIYLVAIFFLRDLLPSSHEIMTGFERLFAKYGYELVFIGAFLEAALLINFLVPGASVVLVGAYFASQGVISYPVFLLVAIAGFFCGFLVDYLIGYYGWADILGKMGMGKYVEMAKKKLLSAGGKSFFLGYFHPDVATIFAIAAGITKMDLREFIFYSFAAGTVWLLFWTGLVYIFGDQIRSIFENRIWMLLILVLFVPAIISSFKKK